MGAEKQHSSFRRKQNKGSEEGGRGVADWFTLRSYCHQIHVPFLLFLRSWIMDLKSIVSYPLTPEGLESCLCLYLLNLPSEPATLLSRPIVLGAPAVLLH